MSTCQQIITRALGKLGIVGAGQVPTTDDNALGLQALVALYRHLITAGAFGELYDVIPTGTTYTAAENERVMHDSTLTVVLPTTISNIEAISDYDGTSFVSDENTIRPPRDGSIIVDINTTTGVTTDWLYDGQTKTWRKIQGLATTDTAPHSFRDENGLAALLATHLADEFGQQISQTIAKHAFDYQLGLTQNWSQAGSLIPRIDYW
jgi:hypothetical protein